MAGNSLYDLYIPGAGLPAAQFPPNALADAALGSVGPMIPTAMRGDPNDVGVPVGVNGEIGPNVAQVRQMQAAADQRRARDAIVRYGDDTTIIPSLSELGDTALSGLQTIGDAALAFGPQGEILALPERGVATVLQAIRGAPRAAAATVVGERALPKQNPEKIIGALKDEIDHLAARGQGLGNIQPGPLPDVQMNPEEQINALTTVRDNLRNRIAARQARIDEVNANAPPTSVPDTDARPPIRERGEILDAIQGNPYVQPIPGRQGLPTKQQQIDLANQFFEQGGRLDPAGPWGRNMPETVRGVMQRSAGTGTGLAQNLPGIEQAAEGLKYYRQQVADLTAQLQSAREQDIPAVQAQLQDARARADRFMRLWNEARGAGNK